MHVLPRAVIALSLALSLSSCQEKKGLADRSVAELEKMLAEPDLTAQSEAAYALSKHGPAARPAVPALVTALKSPEPAVRQNAALALARIGPEARDAVPALTDALRDREYGVRRQAAEALGEIGPDARSAIPALERLSQETDPCKSGQEALKKIRR